VARGTSLGQSKMPVETPDIRNIRMKHITSVAKLPKHRDYWNGFLLKSAASKQTLTNFKLKLVTKPKSIKTVFSEGDRQVKKSLKYGNIKANSKALTGSPFRKQLD
jgi:hypothetical protein